MLDLEKISSAPWHVGAYDEEFPEGVQCVRNAADTVGGRHDLEFSAAARNDLDYQIRYGIYARRYGLDWSVSEYDGRVISRECYAARGGNDKFSNPIDAICYVGAWIDQQKAS